MLDKHLTFFQHLDELRNRCIKSVIVFSLASCLFYQFIPKILPYLIAPVEKLVFIYPQEAFLAKITLALIGGLCLSLPYILWQGWRFVYSGLKRREKKYVFIFGILSLFLFAAGCAFGFFLVFPAGIKFLISFAAPEITPMITVSKYVSFAAGLTLIFGAVFQMPLVIVFLTKIGIVSPKTLSKRRREAIVCIFIAAAVFTPPDAITQIMLALPLVILYEVSILIARMFVKNNIINNVNKM